MNIEDIDLSVRSYNCLKKTGIDTLEDMIKIRNLGRKNIEEIEWKLHEFGLVLKDKTPPKINGKEKLIQKMISLSNEDLEYVFIGGCCPNEFDLYDEKNGCEGAFCSNCWIKALEMEYER